MREHPKDIGDRSQLAAVLALREAGYHVSLPIGENSRYDLIIERDGLMARVQCKTGRLEGGAIRFRTASSYYHHPHPNMPHKHYKGEIEYFAVYCRETGSVYLVPIRDADCEQAGSLRVEPCRNNQQLRIRWARDYEIGTVAIGGLRAPSGA